MYNKIMTKYPKVVFVLGICGLLFSGYLTATKLFSGSCAFNETCPFLFGYPACLYGFIMFLAITTTAALSAFWKLSFSLAAKIITGISVFGVMFALYFLVPEIAVGFGHYTLILPSCAYGAVFFLIIAVYSISALKTRAVA